MSLKIEDNLAIAEGYYQAMLGKDYEGMEARLDPDVHLITPLAELFGKDHLLESARNLSGLLHDIEFRAKFSSGNQIMMAYDFIFPEPIGKLRASVLMDFKDQLINKIELFYDGRPFETEKDKIFTQR